MKQIERFYYQPIISNSIISRVWTLMLLIIGIVFWLEVTTFNWITALFFAIFILVITIQSISQTIEVIGSDLIINKAIRSKSAIWKINQINDASITRYGIKITYQGIESSFLMTNKSKLQLVKLIRGENK